MALHIDGVMEFLPSGDDPLPSQRLCQCKGGLEMDGLLLIKSEASIKARIPIDKDSRLMAVHGMADGVMHQFRAKPLALLGGGYGKGSKNPTQHLTVSGCDAAEAEMANDGLPGLRDHPVQC